MLLSFVFTVALRPQRPYGLSGTGRPAFTELLRSAYVGNFASETITEKVRKLARRKRCRQRRFLTAIKPLTDTDKLFVGGAKLAIGVSYLLEELD